MWATLGPVLNELLGGNVWVFLATVELNIHRCARVFVYKSCNNNNKSCAD